MVAFYKVEFERAQNQRGKVGMIKTLGEFHNQKPKKWEELSGRMTSNRKLRLRFQGCLSSRVDGHSFWASEGESTG